MDGILQANELEALLNEDLVLQQRAKEQGYEKVAVAIHSDLSAREKMERFDMYKAGRYLAVIGDEQFKEGFDHPPMKTIFDYMRGSLVDKVQIIGRGARKWWNDLKGRFEGLTVVDTTIYIGSTDPREDAQRRRAALRESITVKQVLKDVSVESREYVARKGGRKPVLRLPDIFVTNKDIQYYTSTDDLYFVEDEVAKLRKDNWIDITDEMRELLNAESERTGVGSRALLSGAENIPEGLTDLMIQHWRNPESTVKQCDLDLWRWVIQRYSELPDKGAKVKITDPMRERLNRLILATGNKVTALIGAMEDRPPELTAGLVEGWRKSTKEANQYLWNIFTAHCINLPLNTEKYR